MKEAIIQYNDDPDADGNHMVISWKKLVRCKDCKFYQKPEYGFTKGDCTYGSVWYQTEEDGFCSKAKVKD